MPYVPIQAEQFGVDDSGGANSRLPNLRLEMVEKLGVVGGQFGWSIHPSIFTQRCWERPPDMPPLDTSARRNGDSGVDAR